MYHSFQRYSFLCLLLVVVTGCKKNNKKALVSLEPVSDFKQIIALHSEIPDVMLGFVVDRVSRDANNQEIIEIVYKPMRGTVVSQQGIKQSYVADMELLGWKQIGEFAGETVQLLFERPKSRVLCSVYIESNGTIRVTLLQKPA